MSWWPSLLMSCSVTRKPNASCMKRPASGTFSVVRRQWSSRGGRCRRRSSGIGGGLKRQPVADLLHAARRWRRCGRWVSRSGWRRPQPARRPAAAARRCIRTLERGLEAVRVVDRLALEAEVLEAVPGRLGEDHGVVVVLVPALQVHVVVGALHLAEAEDLGVVRRAQLEVGDPHFDITQTEDSHGLIMHPAVGTEKARVPDSRTLILRLERAR